MAKSKQAKPNRRKRAAKPRRARAKLRRAQARALPPQADDDPVPKNIDEFRLTLARRILTFLGMPRRCRAPICRRTKRCLGPGLRCQRDNPLPALTPDEDAAVKAQLKRALARRLAELGAERQA